MTFSKIEDEVNRVLNGDPVASAGYSAPQEQLLRDARFLAVQLGTFYTTCTEQGIPSGLAEGMTYMLMGRYMQIPTSVQSMGGHTGPQMPPR